MLIWLSHPIDQTTPLYGGARDVRIDSVRCMGDGDPCNSTVLSFPAHTGTHVDAPLHFVADGAGVCDLPPERWVFEHIALVDAPAEQDASIGPEVLAGVQEGTDLLLLRTGFEAQRGAGIYWEHNPGIAPNMGAALAARGIGAIGFDFISLSSFQRRPQGREAHREVLGRNILIFEDMHLSDLPAAPSRVAALPLRVGAPGGDGAPCTVLAWCETH